MKNNLFFGPIIQKHINRIETMTKTIVKNFFKLFGIAALISVMAVTMTGCPFSGTYTRNGNNAILFEYGEKIGTAAVSGNTLTGIYDDEPFTATRTSTDNNPFAGTWTGTIDGVSVSFLIGNTIWLEFCPNNYFGDDAFTYARRRNNATLFSHGERVGTASVLGNRMTGTLDGDSFTFTRSTMPPNPFAGIWTGSWDGIDIEIVAGENNWAVTGIR